MALDIPGKHIKHAEPILEDGRIFHIQLKPSTDPAQFWTELDTLTSGHQYIPDREVRTIHNPDNRPWFASYVLTDAEAMRLETDPRVEHIQVPVQYTGYTIGHTTTQTANFNRSKFPTDTTQNSTDYVNWGLLRSSSATNPYDANNNLTVSNQYNYTLDGSNVDVVIIDSGISAGHQDFTDANNNSRVQKFNWYSVAGLPDIMDISKDYSANDVLVFNNPAGSAGHLSGKSRIGPFMYQSGAISFSIGLAISGLEGMYTDPDTNVVDDYFLKNTFPETMFNNWLFMGTCQAGVFTSNAVTGTEPNPIVHVYKGSTDNGRSYTLQYNGNATEDIYDWNSPTYNINPTAGIQWEVKLTDNNMMELTVFRHDHPVTHHKYYGSTQTLPTAWQFVSNHQKLDLSTYFADTRLVGGATTLSAVLTTADNGNTWTLLTDSHLALVNGNWNIQSGSRTKTDPATLTVAPYDFVQNNLSYSNDNLFRFNTPFAFRVGNPFSTDYFYRDYHGHGTHCAGIAAGKRFGWAKNANIYSMKYNDLAGAGDAGTGLWTDAMYNILLKWHQNKSINPVTGVKNPTVVNMSYGLGWSLDVFNLVNYRGTVTQDPVLDVRSVARGFSDLVMGDRGMRLHVPLQDVSHNSHVDACCSAGIIMCIASGNSNQRLDAPGGADYNNYGIPSPGSTGSAIFSSKIYYNRPGSPWSSQAVYVGAAGANYYHYYLDRSQNISSYDFFVNDPGNTNNLDQKAHYSNNGSAITIWAPGTNIMSTTSGTNVFGFAQYGPVGYQAILSGTSMAAPQVCGLVALWLQQGNQTPAAVQNWLTSNGKPVMYDNNQPDVYVGSPNLRGATNKLMYNPLGSAPAPKPPTNTVTYVIQPNLTTVNEGSAVTWTVKTTNLGTGTLYWTNTGTMTASNFTENINSGSVSILADTGSFTLTIPANSFSQGSKTITINLYTGSITGTLVATAPTVTVNNITPPVSAGIKFTVSGQVLLKGVKIS